MPIIARWASARQWPPLSVTSSLRASFHTISESSSTPSRSKITAVGPLIQGRPRGSSSPSPLILKDEGHSLARPDAHPENAVARLAQAQLRGEREHVAGARGPERMADRDRAPVQVQALVGD